MKNRPDDDEHDESKGRLIWFPVLMVFGFLFFVGTTERIFLSQVKKPGTVVQLKYFHPGYSSRDDSDPPFSQVIVRDDATGELIELGEEGVFEEGDSVQISVSKHDGRVYLDVGFRKIWEFALLLMAFFIIGLRVGGPYFTLAMRGVLAETNGDSKSRRVFAGTCLLASVIFVAIAMIEAWGWPITIYSHFRSLCTGGFVGLAFIVWGSGWFCRGLASLLSALAFVYTFLQLDKSNWYFVNLISVVAIGFAVLVTFARTPPLTAQTPTPSR